MTDHPLSDEDKAREPGFYWVLPVLDVDTDNPLGTYPNCMQPAYWTGTRWEMLGTEEWYPRLVAERIPDHVW